MCVCLCVGISVCVCVGIGVCVCGGSKMCVGYGCGEMHIHAGMRASLGGFTF